VFRVVRTPLTLLILLGILGYGAWWGWTNIWKPLPPPQAKPCVPTKVSKGQLKSSQVTVRVYNGGAKTGQAGDVGRSLRSRDFNVVRIDNTDTKVAATVIVGASAKNPEVLLVKSFFKGATVKADNRPDRTVDVMIGTKYGGFVTTAKTTIGVKTETVCLPAQATPSPGIANS
jgi:hypothetical protein